jgi:hypothetical protein
MRLSRHKTRRVFDAYNIGGETDLREAGEKLDSVTAQSTAQQSGRKRKRLKQAIKSRMTR